MTCACGRQNRTGARFCDGCGKPLAPRCPACGAEARPDALFCDGCGARLREGVSDAAEVRKVVTIVFADLIGSTSLHERLDPESVSLLMDRYHRTMRVPVEAHGGTVVQLLGDGVMCAFGVPRVAEDDAIRAVRAAVGIQRAFADFAREQRAAVGTLGLRVAVNTGEVVVTDDYAAGIGDPLNVAARLQQEARDGDVLVSESTRRLVNDLVTLEPFGVLALKGRTETVTAYRVVSLDRPAGASATPFVGRDEELRRIMALHDSAVASRRARLGVILGSPGLGKSRLMDEVARRLGDGATVLRAQCDAAGGATFAPVAKALRAHLGVEDAAGGEGIRAAIEAAIPGDDVERARIAGGIAALLGGTPASPEETFFVVRRFLAALATTQPVVLAIDDLHWAEPLLLDLTEHLVQWSTDVRLLVLAAARPELREARSSLTVSGGLVAEVVTLAGLDAGAATRLAASVIGAAELPAAVAGRVLATSEGNPLFVGELVRMLVADGALKREGDRWTAGVELARLEMPPTIQALLAARIERLRPEERTVLERAAVIGRQFSRAAVTHLLPRDIADVDVRLEALRRSELIEPDTGWFLGEPVLRFHHVLVRDAAYRRLLKHTRAELHARFADWLEARAGDAVEHEETIGWHFEQAHQHLRELGPVDAQGRVLGERAARHLAAAGRRALGRDDLPLAASLLGRALDRLEATDPARADLTLDWCEALLAAGDVGAAAPAIDELGRLAGESARLRAWHTCLAGQLAALTDPQALRTTAAAVAAAAEALAQAGDAAGEAKAHAVHALALGRLGRVGAGEAALDRALAAARRAHDRRRSNTVLASAPLAALWGPSPVTRASGRCLDVVRVLRITHGAPAVEAVALRCQGVLEALRGRTDAARHMLASSRHMVEELGITQRLLEADVFAGLVELLEGDAVAAERSLRAAYEGLRRHGLGIDAAQAAALLGRALLALDRADEAEALSHESEALAGDDLKAAIAWRGVRAEALARRGEHAAAVELARAAVDIAAATDALLDHADARLALAAALRASGRSVEAAAEEARAIELWEVKGATLLAERARRDVGRVVHEDRPRADRLPTPYRRVQANAATALAAGLEAAIAAGDADALAGLIADEFELLHHPTGTVLDRAVGLASLRTPVCAADARLRHEPMATLRDTLALCRVLAWGSAYAGATFDVGAYERWDILVFDVDARGRLRWAESFAEDQLGKAVARLYERYAEQLPDGPARDRAAATARSVAVLLGPVEALARDTLWTPDIEFVDHRRLGHGVAHGAEEMRRGYRSQFDVADDITLDLDDVLALRPDAFLVHRTQSGTLRMSGGRFETSFFWVIVFGADGRVARSEWFDDDDAERALARFDEVAPGPGAPSSSAIPIGAADKRRVRPNGATAFAARLDAAVADRDLDTVAALHSERLEHVDHTTGVEYGHPGVADGWRVLMRAGQPIVQHEPLATLGESLALLRHTLSATGFKGARFDVGGFGRDQIALFEVDADGRCVRAEAFAVDHLGNAVARLYERHAELLPDGPERARAAATARSVAALITPRDPDRFRAAIAPEIEAVDHRPLGFESTRGADAFLARLRSLGIVTIDVSVRVDDVLAVEPHALLVRRTQSGSARDGGGLSEWSYLYLVVFGSDGLAIRDELFAPDREAEALARFDSLAASSHVPSPRRRAVRANAATATTARFDAAVAARDDAALATLVADAYEVTDHINGVTFDRRGALATWHALMQVPGLTRRQEPVATLGDTLAICRLTVSGHGVTGGSFDVGPYRSDQILLVENDADGRRRRGENFPCHRLGDAIARLYERYAESLAQGPERDRAAATARALAALVGPIDLDRYASEIARDLAFVDHVTLGMGSVRGAAAFLRGARTRLEGSTDSTSRIDDVLGNRPDALLLRWTNVGTDRTTGGACERTWLVIWTFDADGLLCRWEQFDPDREDEALTHFEALVTHTDETPVRESGARFANAATRLNECFVRAWEARDWEGVAATYAAEFRLVDRRTMMHVDLDREQHLASLRAMSEMTSRRITWEVLASRGDRLALFRCGFKGSGGDVGPSEVEWLCAIELNDRGEQIVAGVVFDVDNLDAAYAELDARYAAGEAATHPTVSAAMHAFVRAFASRDWDAVAAVFTSSLVVHDHRLLGWEALFGPTDYVESLRSLVELAPDARLRLDHVRMSRHALLWVGAWVGSREGGAFETPWIIVSEHDAAGRVHHVDQYDTGDLGAAHARFVAVEASSNGDRLARTNVATATMDRVQAAVEARDWTPMREAWTRSSVIDPAAAASVGPMLEVIDGFNERSRTRIRAALADALVVDDHRPARLGVLEGANAYVDSLAVAWNVAPDARIAFAFTLAHAAYGSVALVRLFGTLRDGGAFDSPNLSLTTVANGRLTRLEMFESHDVDAALARFAALRPDPRGG